MAKDVVVVSVNETMANAAQRFESNEISSAPVVNEHGHCVGMLSAADFLRRDGPVCDEGKIPAGPVEHSVAPGEAGRPLSIIADCDTVDSYMAHAVQSVAGETSLLDAARIMGESHIHRLPVLDGDCVVGVISTMDVVAAILNAFDEMDASRDRQREES
jgi:CBS domain-containing protein